VSIPDTSSLHIFRCAGYIFFPGFSLPLAIISSSARHLSIRSRILLSTIALMFSPSFGEHARGSPLASRWLFHLVTS
jgi:hypothetical protein